jgi:tetratricopeptide (TPR) repeat protein
MGDNFAVFSGRRPGKNGTLAARQRVRPDIDAMKPKRPPRATPHHRFRDPDEEHQSLRRRWSQWVPAAILGVIALCYVGSLAGPFMQDDFFSRPGRMGPWDLFEAPDESPMAGRPIPTASMMICHGLFGDAPRGYRVFNVALHAANALLLWGLVRRTLRLPSVGPQLNRLAEPTAAAIALLWAAHPLCTEAVAYITQRTELFVAFFLLATLYCGVRAVGALFPEVWLATGVACCALGMLSKEVMVGAPLLVVLYDRAYLFAGWRNAWQARKGYYLALAATWLILIRILWSGPRSESVGFEHPVTMIQYLQWEALAITEYLRLSVWPTRQSLDHGDLLDPVLPAALQVKALVLGGVILAAFAATLVLWWRRPKWAFLGLWFFVILAPTSSFVPIVTEWCAERRMYLPLMAIVAAAVVAIVAAVGRRRAGDAAAQASTEGDADRHGRYTAPEPRSFAPAAWSPALVVLAILAVATIRRAGLYSDPIALWSSAAELSPSLSRPRANLAQMHYELGIKLRETDAAEAEREFRRSLEEYARSIELNPGEPRLHYNYGKLSMILNDKDSAERSFRRALELRPGYANALKDLGNLLFDRKQFTEAAEKYAALMPLEPGVPDWEYNYGLAMLNLNRPDEALEHFQKTTEFPNAPAEAWSQIARLLLDRGEIAKAEAAVRRALEVNPDSVHARRTAESILAIRKKARGE